MPNKKSIPENKIVKLENLYKLLSSSKIVNKTDNICEIVCDPLILKNLVNNPDNPSDTKSIIHIADWDDNIYIIPIKYIAILLFLKQQSSPILNELAKKFSKSWTALDKVLVFFNDNFEDNFQSFRKRANKFNNYFKKNKQEFFAITTELRKLLIQKQGTTDVIKCVANLYKKLGNCTKILNKYVEIIEYFNLENFIDLTIIAFVRYCENLGQIFNPKKPNPFTIRVCKMFGFDTKDKKIMNIFMEILMSFDTIIPNKRKFVQVIENPTYLHFMRKICSHFTATAKDVLEAKGFKGQHRLAGLWSYFFEDDSKLQCQALLITHQFYKAIAPMTSIFYKYIHLNETIATDDLSDIKYIYTDNVVENVWESLKILFKNKELSKNIVSIEPIYADIYQKNSKNKHIKSIIGFKLNYKNNKNKTILVVSMFRIKKHSNKKLSNRLQLELIDERTKKMNHPFADLLEQLKNFGEDVQQNLIIFSDNSLQIVENMVKYDTPIVLKSNPDNAGIIDGVFINILSLKKILLNLRCTDREKQILCKINAILKKW